MSILSVLLIGVFVANIDMTLLIATYPQISSDLHAFKDGAWLITAYMLAMCATQPLYGKLANIFGRKKLLICTYMLYATGSTLCAIARDIRQLIAARVISGMGGAGMVCLVSIIITDIVPLREVAAYRSYVNVIQTIGRSVGAPIGGLVVQKSGWRAAFASIAPLTLLGAVLVAWKLEVKHQSKSKANGLGSKWASVKRIDFLGATLLSCAIISLLLLFSLSGDRPASADPRIPVLGALTVFLTVIFYYVENYWAAEPIFPTFLLGIRDVVASYGLLFMQNAAQAAASLTIPLFFQILLSVGPSKGGLFLLPSVVGNTVGGLASGYYIKRFGQYKVLCLIASVSAAISYLLMSLRWTTRSDFHPIVEDAYVIGAGLGTGMAHAAAFVVLTSGVSAHVIEDGGDNEAVHDNIAIAGSGIYLSGNLGGTVGISVSNAILHWLLKRSLAKHFDGRELEEITRKTLDSVAWVQSLDRGSKIRETVVEAYVTGMRGTYAQAAIFSLLGLLLSFLIIEHKLQ